MESFNSDLLILCALQYRMQNGRINTKEHTILLKFMVEQFFGGFSREHRESKRKDTSIRPDRSYLNTFRTTPPIELHPHFFEVSQPSRHRLKTKCFMNVRGNDGHSLPLITMVK